jgi:F-type H+-transporting ATPase subunit gamma
MKMVAAARLRKAQDRMMDARLYTSRLREIVDRLLAKSETTSELFRMEEKPGNILVLVMGSDRGLCGGFNTNLFRVLENRLHDDHGEALKENRLSLICFGKKAYDYFRLRNYTILDHKIGFFDHLKYEHVSEVMNRITEQFRGREWDEVYLAFNEFKSVIAQQRRFVRVLPVRPSEVQFIGLQDAEIADIAAAAKKKKRAEQAVPVETGTKKRTSDIDYLYEPDAATIFEYVLPLYISIQMWQASLESFAAEQGARMTAMDSATENAGDIIRDLQLKYNQARQAAITTEISEIVSGAEALSS